MLETNLKCSPTNTSLLWKWIKHRRELYEQLPMNSHRVEAKDSSDVAALRHAKPIIANVINPKY